MACRGFLQCLLKLFNLALALVGVLLLVFSISLLVKQQSGQSPPAPPSPAPAPPSPDYSSSHPVLQDPSPRALAAEGHADVAHAAAATHSARPEFSSGTRPLAFPVSQGDREAALEASSTDALSLRAPKLPKLWVTYLLIGVGAYITLLTLMGAVAAESNIVCCMTTYQFGLCLLILLQLVAAALVWLDEVPPDPTGEYDKRRKFVEDNLELCKLAALCLLLVEGIALLLAMMLRAIQVDEAAVDDEDDYLVLPRSHLLQQQQQQAQRRLTYSQPLLAPGQVSVPTSLGATTALGPTGSGTPHTDTWRARLMEKAVRHGPQ